MTREELIEKEAIKYSEEKWKHPSSNLSRAHCSLDYENGINSQLAKDLQELAVIEGKIEVYEICSHKGQIWDNKIAQLETYRKELLTKLNLEG